MSSRRGKTPIRLADIKFHLSEFLVSMSKYPNKVTKTTVIGGKEFAVKLVYFLYLVPALQKGLQEARDRPNRASAGSFGKRFGQSSFGGKWTEAEALNLLAHVPLWCFCCRSFGKIPKLLHKNRSFCIKTEASVGKK